MNETKVCGYKFKKILSSLPVTLCFIPAALGRPSSDDSGVFQQFNFSISSFKSGTDSTKLFSFAFHFWANFEWSKLIEKYLTLFTLIHLAWILEWCLVSSICFQSGLRSVRSAIRGDSHSSTLKKMPHDYKSVCGITGSRSGKISFHLKIGHKSMWKYSNIMAVLVIDTKINLTWQI